MTPTVQRDHVALPVLDHVPDQRASHRIAGEDAIVVVGHAMRAAGRVGLGPVDGLGDGVGKVELRGHKASLVRVGHEVDVDCPGGVPAGIDGLELGDAVGVGDLLAAEEGLAGGVGAVDALVAVARVPAEDVRVPDVDGGAGDRLARSGLDESQGDEEGRALQALGDIAPEIAGVEVEGALGLGRGPDAVVEGNRGLAVCGAASARSTEASSEAPSHDARARDSARSTTRPRSRSMFIASSIAAGARVDGPTWTERRVAAGC